MRSFRHGNQAWTKVSMSTALPVFSHQRWRCFLLSSLRYLQTCLSISCLVLQKKHDFKTFQFTAEGYQAAKRSVWLIWRNYCWINQTAGPFTLIFSHFYLAEQRQTCRAGLLFVTCVLKGARACAFSTCEVQRCTVLKTVASSTGCLLLHRLYADEERGDYLQRLFGLNLKIMCLSSCFAAPWWWKKEKNRVF